MKLRPLARKKEYTLLVSGYIAAITLLLGELMRIYITGAMRFGFTPDLPWLLQTGHYILAHGEIPARDIFSWTAADRPLVAYQWFFEVLLAWIQRHGGIDFLIELFAFLGILLYVLVPLALNARYRIPLFIALPIGAAAAAVATYNLQVRPMFATCAFLLLQYALLEQRRLGRISMKALIPATIFSYALWANMHILVLFGLVSLGLMVLGDALQRSGLAEFEPPDPALEGQPIAWREYALLFGASILGSLINPYGYDIYLHLFDTMKDTVQTKVVGELLSPNFHNTQMEIFAGLMVLFIVLMTHMRRILAPHEVLHILAFGFATLFTARFVVWAALFFAIILPRALHRLSVDSLNRYEAIQGAIHIIEHHRGRIITAFMAISLLFTLAVPGIIESPSTEACAKYGPTMEAYQRLKRDTDRLFNDDVIGSCMHLDYPEQKVFIDTRFDFHGDTLTREVTEALQLSQDWKAVFDKWNIDTFVLRKGLPLTELLSELPGYMLLYEDGAAMILRIRTGQDVSLEQRAQIDR